MYENKYSTEKIVEALEPWEKFKHINVPKNSVNSKLLYSSDLTQYANPNNNIVSSTNSVNNNDVEANLLFIKYRSTTICSLLHHWFLDINNVQRWHPGNGEDGNILVNFKEDDDDLKNNTLVSIYEFCHKCTYWFLLNKFYKDAGFHLVFHNCEIIFDYFQQTILIQILIISLAFFFFTGGHLIMFICAITIFLILVSSTFKHNSASLYKCPHILDHVVNRRILKVV